MTENLISCKMNGIEVSDFCEKGKDYVELGKEKQATFDYMGGKVTVKYPPLYRLEMRMVSPCDRETCENAIRQAYDKLMYRKILVFEGERVTYGEVTERHGRAGLRLEMFNCRTLGNIPTGDHSIMQYKLLSAIDRAVIFLVPYEYEQDVEAMLEHTFFDNITPFVKTLYEMYGV